LLSPTVFLGLVSSQFLAFQQVVREANASIPFYFHGGETLFMNNARDENLFDALLLDSKRIGHGYAFRHHPLLLEMIKSKQVAIEICPISNQVLEV
jgi:adenosine deaminase CECR1